MFIDLVVLTSKVPRRAPGGEGSVCLNHCCAETILSRPVLYDRLMNVFSDDSTFSV